MTRALSPLVTDEWRSWEPEEKRQLLDALQAARVAQLQQAWSPYPWQHRHVHPPGRPPGPCDATCLTLPEPPPVPTLGAWLLMGGRGTGKTDGGSHYMLEHVAGPPCDKRVRGGHRMLIIAPTLGDAVESCVNGPSGLRAYDPRVTVTGSTGGTYVRFPGGAEAMALGASTPRDVERLRAKGANRCLTWLEEAGAQAQLGLVMDLLTPGMRLGRRPHYVITTTPKVRPEVKALVADPDTQLTWGRTRDATHMDPAVRAKLEARMAGTRLGRQELDGELLVDVEGALWRQWQIDRARHTTGPTTIPSLRRVVVGVDPNAGGPDECGIVAVGITRDRMPDATGRDQVHAYVLADRSDHFDHPGQWAKAACDLYDELGADAVVAEVNNGGDMVGHTIHVHDPRVRYRAVRATRGKARRAEPVVALYEQQRVHHAGVFPQLEGQQTTWVDEPGADSPDRMDALVWALTDLLLRGGGSRAGVA